MPEVCGQTRQPSTWVLKGIVDEIEELAKKARSVSRAEFENESSGFFAKEPYDLLMRLHVDTKSLGKCSMKAFRKILAASAIVATCFLATTQAYAADIVDTAIAAGNFTTLVAAIQAAGLVDTLKGKGPFTVFAPTDEAFAKLPKGTVEDLLKPANKAKLVSILTYHVVPGKVMAADIDGKDMQVKTVQGSELHVAAKTGVKVNDANVVKADIAADNGVIHVIDAVLMPKM